MRKISLLLIVFGSLWANAQENILELFPDTGLRSAIRFDNRIIDTNGDLKFSAAEAAAFTGNLVISNRGIEDYTGIEYFKNITSIQITANPATSIDLTPFKDLKLIGAQSVGLTSIDVSQNLELENLFMPDNSISSLDLSKNTKLRELTVLNNDNLTSLDVSNNTELWALRMSNTGITSLDLSNNTKLGDFSCNDNNFTNFDLSQNTALYYFTFNNNQVSTIDFSNNSNLTQVSGSGNPLQLVDLSANGNLYTVSFQNCPLLERIDLRNGSFTSNTNTGEGEAGILSAKNNPNLTEICVDDVTNAITLFSFNVDNTDVFSTCEEVNSCPDFVSIPDPAFEQALSELGLDSDGLINGRICKGDANNFQYTMFINEDKGITDLTGLEHFVNTLYIGIANNNIQKEVVLPVSENVKGILLPNNGITELVNLDKLPNLDQLEVADNNISSIDISQNQNLSILRIQNNNLTGSLDFSSNPALTRIDVAGNTISTIDLTTGTNTDISYFNALDNPDLRCIQVDDVVYAESQLKTDPNSSTGWFINGDSYFSEDCRYVRITDNTRIEAEDFNSQDGVVVEDITEDEGSNQAIGYLQPTDSATYLIDVEEAGTYNLTLRVAGLIPGGITTIKIDNQIIKSVSMPVTGGWQNWELVQTAIDLEKGPQEFTLEFSGAAFAGNINWMEFIKIEAVSSVKIQAEDFSSEQGVQVVSTNGAGEGDAIGFLQPGDSASYMINMSEAGSYSLNMNVATAIPHGVVTFSSDGTYLGEIKVPNTGGWSNYQVLSTDILLPAGMQELTLDFSSAAYIGNIDWLEIIPLGNKSANKVVGSNIEKLTLFPNPVIGGEVTIQTENEILSVSVLNTNGQEVLENMGASNKINVSKLDPGFYLIKVNTPNVTLTKKLLVK